jgi:hypothetical protein
MLNSIVLPIGPSAAQAEWSEGLDTAAVERIKSAARQNIDLLRGGISQCVHVALEASEDVAATMIDYAIQLNSQVKDAVQRYGVPPNGGSGLVNSGCRRDLLRRYTTSAASTEPRGYSAATSSS